MTVNLDHARTMLARGQSADQVAYYLETLAFLNDLPVGVAEYDAAWDSVHLRGARVLKCDPTELSPEELRDCLAELTHDVAYADLTLLEWSLLSALEHAERLGELLLEGVLRDAR